MVPGDRLICAFVENREEGSSFSSWPLHVTVIPWFRTEVDTEDITRNLTERLRHIGTFPVTMAGEAGFGSRGHKLVNLIELPSPFVDIERKARTLLHEYDAWIVDESTEVKRLFKPHVTAQGSLRMNEGETFRCDRLYIIEQKGEHKQVTGSVEL